MKTYKDFETIYIGGSDSASLILMGIKETGQGRSLEFLNFGEDGEYYAYLIHRKENEPVEIGEHYKKVATFTNWLKIYDDYESTLDIKGRVINVYRAGEFGCIIEVID